MRQKSGFSLLQLLVAMSIVASISLFAVPSLVDGIKHQQHKSALQSSYYLLQFAKSIAIRRGASIGVQFLSSAQGWCIAVSETLPCDCQVANHCHVEQIEHKLSSAEFPYISLSKLTMGKQNFVSFDGVTGLAYGHAGSGRLSDGIVQSKLIISNLGRVRICIVAGQLGAFRKC